MKTVAKPFGAIFEDWDGRRETLTWTSRADRNRFARGAAPLGYRRVVAIFDLALAVDQFRTRKQK